MICCGGISGDFGGRTEWLFEYDCDVTLDRSKAYLEELGLDDLWTLGWLSVAKVRMFTSG